MITKWETSTKFTLSRRTFSALRQTNNAISDPSSDLLSEGYKLQIRLNEKNANCLERRFSHYRQTSRGRFLVSLREVINSESIFKVKSLLQDKLKISAFTMEPNQDYEERLLKEQVLKYNERATLARVTRVVIYSIFVLGPSALGMGESYL